MTNSKFPVRKREGKANSLVLWRPLELLFDTVQCPRAFSQMPPETVAEFPKYVQLEIVSPSTEAIKALVI